MSLTRTKCLWALALLLALLWPGQAQATNIRVCLQTGVNSVELKVVEGTYQIKGGSLSASLLAEADEGDLIRTVRNGAIITVYVNGKQVGTSNVNVSVLATGSGRNVISYGNRQYRGSISLLSNGYVLNVLDMEHYLYGVVGQELTYSYPKEALKAQAIVARSYAYYNLGGTYYDVGRSTADQVYGGFTAAKAAGGNVIVEVVDSTAHQVLHYNGKPVEALYCSSAGGHTENNENVWSGAAQPYLRGVPSPYDANYNYMNWQVDYSASKLAELANAYMKRIKQDGSFGSFVSLEISYIGAGGQATASGRAAKVTMVGTGATVVAENDNIRSLLGLKSTLFSVKEGLVQPPQEPEPAPKPAVVTGEEVYVLNGSGNKVQRKWADVFAVDSSGVTQQLGDLAAAHVRSAETVGRFGTAEEAATDSSSDKKQNAVQTPGTVTVTGGLTLIGNGYGHGVGLSQFGAVGMAKNGSTAWEILQHYYGGDDKSKLELKKIS